MSKIDQSLTSKIDDLLEEVPALGSNVNEGGQLREVVDRAKCKGWLISADHVIQQVCTMSDSYAVGAKRIPLSFQFQGFMIYHCVLEMASLLERLREDIQKGRLRKLSDSIRAEAFSNFLEHGRAYLNKSSKAQAGVIIGVVFEDTVRKICEKISISQAGRSLEQLIAALKNADTFIDAQASRARAAATVRTKATHAQWSEFELKDVQAALEFTDETIQRCLS